MTRRILFTCDRDSLSHWPDVTQWEVVTIDQPDDDRRVIAAAQILLPIVEPIVLGGHGGMGALLPRLGFARRTARRRVEGYHLIDSDLPRVAGDWPDAPVTYTATTDAFAIQAKVAGERGWRVS